MSAINKIEKSLNDLGLTGIGGQGSNNPIDIALAEFADEVVQALKSNLDTKNNMVSGGLRQSIDYIRPIAATNGEWKIEFVMADYGKFVDKGVKGVENSQNTTSPFSFKFINPSKKHISSMATWFNEKGVTEISHQYALTTNLKKHGTNPTNFITEVANNERWSKLARNLEKIIGKKLSVSV